MDDLEVPEVAILRSFFLELNQDTNRLQEQRKSHQPIQIGVVNPAIKTSKTVAITKHSSKMF